MKTTREEALAAAEWCLEQGYDRIDLVDVLERIGYGDLARGLA